MNRWWRRMGAGKLKNYLLAWTLAPIALFMAVDSVSLYRSGLQTTAAAHDRLLKATAQQMGDLLRVERNSLTIQVPLALIEALEGSGGSRMYWRVIGFDGRDIAGDADLPLPPGDQVKRTPGLTYSYVAQVASHRVQVTALHQPRHHARVHHLGDRRRNTVCKYQQKEPSQQQETMMRRARTMMMAIVVAISKLRGQESGIR